MGKYILELKMAQAQERLKIDIEQALGTPQEQYERLARLIDAAGPQTKAVRELRKDIEVQLDFSQWRNHAS